MQDTLRQRVSLPYLQDRSGVAWDSIESVAQREYSLTDMAKHGRHGNERDGRTAWREMKWQLWGGLRPEEPLVLAVGNWISLVS